MDAVDESWNDFDAEPIVIDGHFSSRRCEEFALVDETFNFRQSAQLLMSDVVPTAEVNCSRISHVEAWINQELFGVVVEESTQPHQDETGEVDITTLGKHFDECIEIMDPMYTTCDSRPWISYNGIVDEGRCYSNSPEDGMDDLSLSPVDSEWQGMYDDEPQLWCFTS